MVRKSEPSPLSRRDFLKALGLGAGSMVLSSCTSQRLVPTQVPTATAPPMETPFQPVPPAVTATPIEAQAAISGLTGTPDPRKLCFVLWDHQLARYGYKPRDLGTPLPQTCPLYSGGLNLITREWLEYWKGILHVCNPDVSGHKFDSAWDSLVADDRAFTNGSGPNSGLFALHSLTCGGATHEMVTGIPEGDYMRIYTLNSRKPAPPIPSSPDEIDITRHFFATTGSRLQLPDGSYAVYGFPQFENCIVPLVSPYDSDLIEVSRIKVVTSVQRPYNT